jgi:endo-1,4-beta-D-glucanase Y
LACAVAAALVALSIGCSPAATVSGSGGSSATGGTSGSGGSSGSGGATATGGSGGATASGGSGSGGTTASGGSSSGGTTASGGSVGSGGSNSGGSNTGGSTASGGSVGSGGSNSGGSSSGGATGQGGAGGAAGGATASVTIPRGGRCTPPRRASTADVQAAYAKWKTDLLTADGAGPNSLRVRRPNSGDVLNGTVSEGIGYGMLIAVYLNDQPTFDKLWNYEQQFLDANGLMNWYIGPDHNVLGMGGATDGDEDMAFALLLADKRWGGMGSRSKTYLSEAITLINAIWKYEIDHTRNDVPTPGDMGGGGGSVTNISYFAPAFYRAFGRATGQQANWDRVVNTCYTVLAATLNSANKNATNGLVPAWSTPAGVPMPRPNTSDPTHHQLDSCRTPFRLAQDYCWNNEPKALDYLKKISGFYQMKGAKNILDGYNLDGTDHPGAASVGNQSAAFVGPAGVGAMASPDFATLRDEAYDGVATLNQLAGSTYYNESWTVLSLIMMTGLMDDLTLP